MNNFGIPIYEATIKTADDGIMAIALVDHPAVESDFQVFNKKEKVVEKFFIQDEDKHLITGVVMRCNFPIYRYSENLGEYYIFYAPETIKLMAEKMMKDNNQNEINIMHNDNEFVEGVNLVELFIKDSSKGVSPKGFEDIEEGSLFATYKINNEEVWKDIKNGTFKGLSLQGFFSIEPFEKTDDNVELKKINNNNDMKNILKMMKTLIKLGSVETDKQTLYWLGDEDLKAGDAVFVDGEETNPAEDGEYVTIDGKVITVKDGVVENIEDSQAEVEAEDETPAETPAEEKPAEDEVKRLAGLIDELTKRIEALEEKLKTVEETPGEDPLEEKYSKQKGAFNHGKVHLIGM